MEESSYLIRQSFSSNTFLASSILNDMFTYFEQLRYLDFYTLIKLSVILPHGVCKIPRKF
jgi:hypothetical protein